MKPEIRSRIRLLSGVFIVGALVLICTLYWIQIVRGNQYIERADHQYLRPDTLFDRGEIFFSERTGNEIAAATVRSGFTLVVNPRILIDPEAAYKLINQILPIDHDAFIQKTSVKTDPYEEIAKRVDQKAGEAIEALAIKGVTLYRDHWRFYPGGNLASHAIGFVSFKENELTGSYGIERYWNDTLKRNEGDTYVNFFAEVFSKVQTSLLSKNNQALEGDLNLTIEPTVQARLQDTIDKVEKAYSSKMTGGIIIDPKTGEIYAMAISPTFDLNNFQKEKNPLIYSNPLVENVYEMGSIVKPLAMAAGLDAGVVKASTTYDDKGSLTLNGKKISNFDGKGRGPGTSMQEVLNQSLNTGMTFVMQRLGQELFPKYMMSYGLGEETGIDLPNETYGLVGNLKSPREIELATASFGQGIAITPIETVRALASLGNGGYLITPHLVKEVHYTLGFSKKIEYPLEKQVLKKETSAEISRMLVNVVDKALLGGSVKQEHYSIAAKTGTAQIAKPGGGGYYEDKFLHSFFGYFPAYDPQFLVFLYTVEPQGVEFASHTLTNPFIDLTKFLINYYQVPPDR